MRDLLFPSTDAGVLGQVVGLVAVTVVAVWLVRRERSLVLLVIGVALVVFGVVGLRALH